MNDNQNVQIIQRGYEAFGRGDLNALLDTFDEQVEWVTPGGPELATSGRRRGRQAVAEFFGAVNDLVEIQRFEPRTFVADGDRVVVLGGETARVRATGKVLEVEWVHAFTFRNGRVIAFQEYFDTAPVVAELRAAHAAA